MDNSWYPEVEWFGFDRVDGTIQFYTFVNSLCRPDYVVLDYGAGRAEYLEGDTCAYRRNLHNLKGRVKKLIGVDMDDVVLLNESLDEAYLLGEEGAIPLPDESIDLIVSDWVFEHIEAPAKVAAEFRRVLKPGGYVCARTPNRSGYIALSARLIPERLHSLVLRIVQPKRKEQDVFPKFYRLNSRLAVGRAFPAGQFDALTFCTDASLSYAGRSKLLSSLFKVLHWLSPEPMKSVRLIFARKTVGA
ncbi:MULTISPECIES: class I SAM-dependent methyltransferase [unclassified Bradyrhizobium]|nr:MULTISPECIES: class I SAM-dependent methyltransferase [unclassified Bradyrhizobium]